MSNYPSTGRDAAPRFEVCSITGFDSVATKRLTTSFWIADRDRGFSEVETFYSPPSGTQHLDARLSRALQRCAELNAENDAFMRQARL